MHALQAQKSVIRGSEASEKMEIEADRGKRKRGEGRNVRPKICSAGFELFAQCVLQMDQRIYGNCCSCLVIIYSLHLAIEIQVLCNTAVGYCQITVKYPACTLAAKVAKDFDQSKQLFLYCILQTLHFFPLLRSMVTFRKV